MIIEIATEVYETIHNNFAALVVFYDQEGNRTHKKEYFDDEFEATSFAFNTAFADLKMEEFSAGTYRSNKNKNSYHRNAK